VCACQSVSQCVAKKGRGGQPCLQGIAERGNMNKALLPTISIRRGINRWRESGRVRKLGGREREREREALFVFFVALTLSVSCLPASHFLACSSCFSLFFSLPIHHPLIHTDMLTPPPLRPSTHLKRGVGQKGGRRLCLQTQTSWTLHTQALHVPARAREGVPFQSQARVW